MVWLPQISAATIARPPKNENNCGAGKYIEVRQVETHECAHEARNENIIVRNASFNNFNFN